MNVSARIDLMCIFIFRIIEILIKGQLTKLNNNEDLLMLRIMICNSIYFSSKNKKKNTESNVQYFLEIKVNNMIKFVTILI